MTTTQTPAPQPQFAGSTALPLVEIEEVGLKVFLLLGGDTLAYTDNQNAQKIYAYKVIVHAVNSRPALLAELKDAQEQLSLIPFCFHKNPSEPNSPKTPAKTCLEDMISIGRDLLPMGHKDDAQRLFNAADALHSKLVEVERLRAQIAEVESERDALVTAMEKIAYGLSQTNIQRQIDNGAIKELARVAGEIADEAQMQSGRAKVARAALASSAALTKGGAS